MRFKNLFTLLMALALAGMVAFVGNAWIESRLDQTQEEEVNVVVAAADIPAYSTISPNQLRLDRRPRRLTPADPVQDPAAIVGKKLRESVYRGEILLSKRVVDDSSSSPLLEALPRGMRVMTLRLDDISGHAGFLLPGSRVDIISLQSGQKATTVLKNIKVLAVGQTLIAEGSTVKGGTVTVEVTPQQAEILTEISSAGGIRLVLRRQNDDTGLDVAEPETATSGGPAAEDASRAPPSVVEKNLQEPETFPVIVIRGIVPQRVTLAEPRHQDMNLQATPEER